MKSLTKERIPMADWVKAFAIYLVVVSHTAIARPVANWAFMVEIPLFFFMSGYLFRFRSNPLVQCLRQEALPPDNHPIHHDKHRDLSLLAARHKTLQR